MTNLNLKSALLAATLLAGSASLYATGESKNLDYSTAQELNLMVGFPPEQNKLVTKENWLKAPYNRYAFLHIRELFPTKPFQRSKSPSTEFIKNINGSLSQLQVKDVKGNTILLDDFLKRAYTDAFLILHHGKIVYERYWNGSTEADPHALFSITKSFTGTLVGILEARGLIDYEKTVSHYLPELKDSGYGDATIQQMMDMEVGVAWEETPSAMADPNSVFQQYAASVGVAPSAEISSSYAFLPTMKKVNEHGEKFQYVAPVTDVLGWLIERVSGKSYTQVLDDEIISKLHLRNDGFMLLDGWGKAFSTGGLNLTPRDLARFGLMIQNGGYFEGERIVPEEFIKDSRFNGNKEKFKKGEKDSFWLPGGAYHNQWWIPAGDRPAIQAAGIYGQNLYIDIDAEVIIVRVSSLPGSHDATDELMTPLYQKISKILSAN